MKRTKRKAIERNIQRKAKSECPSKKIQYMNELDANRALLKAWQEGHTKLNAAYKCPECRFWHLTSSPGRRNNGRSTHM